MPAPPVTMIMLFSLAPLPIPALIGEEDGSVDKAGGLYATAKRQSFHLSRATS
jgi:hypothetical protein